MKRYILAAACLFPISGHAFLYEDALGKYLRVQEHVSTVPNHFSYWVPGGIVVVKDSHELPDYKDPASDARPLTLQPATAMMNAVNSKFTVSSTVALSTLTSLFGATPAISFSGSHSVDFTQMNFTGWRLGTDDIATLLKKDSPTYKVVDDNWVKAGIMHNSRIYLIEAVFLTNAATLTTGTSGGIGLGMATGCGASGAAAADTGTGTGTGTATSPTVSALKDTVTSNTAQAPAQLKGCLDGTKTVRFSTPTPVPTAMLLRRIGLLADGSLSSDPELVKF